MLSAHATLPAKGMDLAATLFCGQTFSWHQNDDNYFYGMAGSRSLVVWQQEDTLFLAHPDGTLTPKDLAFWQHYFALDTDYEALHAKFTKHQKLAVCVSAFPGIRVLRQPFWDTLLSFIISQNNNISRITGIVGRLCQTFGQQLPGAQYMFPSAQALAQLTPEDLSPLRAGFRAKYLIDAARKVASGEVDETRLRSLNNNDARDELKLIYGVGDKVADCVLLFGLGRDDIAPMDVWMKRAMEQIFPKGMPKAAKGAEGIAQQYIFHWARQNLPAANAAAAKTKKQNK